MIVGIEYYNEKDDTWLRIWLPPQGMLDVAHRIIKEQDEEGEALIYVVSKGPRDETEVARA